MAKNNDAQMWGIHGGKLGEAEDLFLRKKYVALGWPKVPDLSKLAADRDDFKAAVLTAYPDSKPGAIPNNAGQLFRFVHEMKIGDWIAYPSKKDRLIHFGKIEGDYQYDKDISDRYPHQRAVNWIKKVPRTSFSQGALYEIGSAITFFLIKSFYDEFRAAAEGKVHEEALDTYDPTIAETTEDIEERTRDFVLGKLAKELKGHPFADFVAHLLGTMGYRTRVSDPGPDGGIDILAHRDELGFEPPIIKVQVKSTEGSIGDPAVSSLYGKVGTGEYGLLVTLGTFTNQAKAFAKSKSNLRLIDGDELVKLVFSHYDQFDSRYKGLIPLRRVYVPEVVDIEN